MSDDPADNLVLTPQLQIAIRMLSSTHEEMQRWLAEACASHPALRWRRPAAVGRADAEIYVEGDGLRCEIADDGELEVDEDAPEEERRAAAWMVRAVERRQESIARLLALVIEAQAPFLRGDAAAPAALGAAALADELGSHETTVKRLVEGKRLSVAGREVALGELVG